MITEIKLVKLGFEMVSSDDSGFSYQFEDFYVTKNIGDIQIYYKEDELFGVKTAKDLKDLCRLFYEL